MQSKTRKMRQGEHVPECPSCHEDMDHIDTTTNEGITEDCYTCEKCEIIVTYESPDGYEYHELDRSEITMVIEQAIGSGVDVSEL